ncbi:Uncharacterized protein HZ326_5270 [Fusarium oxysporum f. sp. albedinis]|nr:Uncharacterized protein HZ326_5270 [Fusarium oxysporum f. sp. albedinis]
MPPVCATCRSTNVESRNVRILSDAALRGHKGQKTPVARQHWAGLSEKMCPEVIRMKSENTRPLASLGWVWRPPTVHVLTCDLWLTVSPHPFNDMSLRT